MTSSSASTSDVDVVVIGAGNAGLTAAVMRPPSTLIDVPGDVFTGVTIRPWSQVVPETEAGALGRAIEHLATSGE